MRTRRLFDALLARRGLLLLAVLAFTAVLAALAARVRTDQSIEAMFPVYDPVRATYDRYKARFPHDDARAIVIVEGKDLFTGAGLARVRALEEELGALPHVMRAYIEGPQSARDVRGEEGTILLERVFPDGGPALEDQEVQARLARARADPLFAWSLVHPTRDVASIQVLITAAAATDAKGRAEFSRAAQDLVRRHEAEWDRIVLTGIPAIRARYIESVNADTALLLPAALLVILAILGVTYRSPRVVLGALVTILASVLWTFGFMGALDIPVAVLTAFAPIVVMVISISDTVHIVQAVDDLLAAGVPRRAAVAEGVAASAGPCLLTELTIAAGFLSLGLVNIVAILEFGAVTAGGMLFAWLANMTVLPLLLSVGRDPAPVATAAATATTAATTDLEAAEAAAHAAGGGPIRRFVGWIERQVTQRPRVVVATSLVVLAAAGSQATSIRRLTYVFEDLRRGSVLEKEIRYAEAAHGGLVPVAIFLEPEVGGAAARSEAPALEPEALRFLDRAEAKLRSLPAVKAARTPATYLRKAHRAFTGREAALRTGTPGSFAGIGLDYFWTGSLTEDGRLPRTRSLAVKEVDSIDKKLLFDTLDDGRRTAACVALVPDMPSPEVAAFVAEIEGFVARETPPGYRASVTGVLAIADRVTFTLVGGLVRSFGTAILVTAIVFCAVLRSVRLAAIGLIPNLAPIVLMLGVMATLGIHLKPSTVILFSMALTIADDDTIQFLSRFRRRLARAHARGDADPHREAALAVLRETALPMFVTSTTITAGFLVLQLSEFQGTANLGTILGVTLFSAVFADAFLTPIVILKWKPRVFGRDSRTRKHEDTKP